jgi:ribosomal protein S18 acetylase RimI-like enzyme
LCASAEREIVRHTTKAHMGDESRHLTSRSLHPGDESIASALAMLSYRAATTTSDSAEGIEEFTRYASAFELGNRMRAGSIVMIACRDERPVGVVEIRSPGHIGLLFVLPESQQSGVGRYLCEVAPKEFAQQRAVLLKLTVNSSPGAVGFYEKMGFSKTGEITERNGIRFVPMERVGGVQPRI